MDATVVEKRDRLIKMFRNLDSTLLAEVFPGGSANPVQKLSSLSPEIFIKLLDKRLPLEIQRETAALIVAILLDTTYLERFGLLQTLGFTPTTVYLPMILEAMQTDILPEGVRRLGQIGQQQTLYDCHTFACILFNASYAHNLLHMLTGYRT